MSNNKIASYMNLKGTTLPSFKMGKNGIELRSKAQINGENITGLFFQSNIEDNTDIELKEELGENYPKFDIAIPSKNIRRMYISNGETLKIVLTNGKILSFSQSINVGDLILPEDAQDGEIAIYSRNDNKVSMGRSGITITNEIGDIDESESSKIPTVTAVRSHLTNITENLNTRLSGNNVNEI